MEPSRASRSDADRSTVLDGPWGLTLGDQGDKAHTMLPCVLEGVVARFDSNVPDQNGGIGSGLVRQKCELPPAPCATIGRRW